MRNIDMEALTTEIFLVLERFDHARRETAQRLYDLGVYLECPTCHTISSGILSVKTIANYLEAEWPKCCGVTMRLKR